LCLVEPVREFRTPGPVRVLSRDRQFCLDDASAQLPEFDEVVISFL
jgi:hypothetical protein